MKVDLSIRPPTGRAWLVSAASVIIAGELLFELRKQTPASFFNIPFTDAELIPWIILFAVIAVISITYLVSLYLAPGRLEIDPEGGIIRRTRRHLIRREVVEAPAGEWKTKILYFSEEQRTKGVFKRVELAGPGFEEVLLFADLKDGERLTKGLEELGEAMASFEVETEKAA